MADLKNTTIDSFNFIRLPRGTTNERPSNPDNGYMRFNTTTNSVEAYIDGSWVSENKKVKVLKGPIL